MASLYLKPLQEKNIKNSTLAGKITKIEMLTYCESYPT